MPSWSDFLLPHPEPRPRAGLSSSSTHPHPHSHHQHHLSAQGYLQPPPRSRYRPPPGSCSSSAQSSVHDLLALRLVVSSSGHNHIPKRPRADSAVITSASCTSFSCASARGRGSWQAVAEVFGAKGKESQTRDRKGKGKRKENGRERTPPPRIGALAFEVEEQDDQDEEAESGMETDWENVTLEEAAGSDVEGRKHDWGKVGLAISRRLLRSRSGENLDRNGHWSGRGGGGGSVEGTSPRDVGMGVGRGRGKETPGQRQDVSSSKAKRIAIGLNEKTDAVDHYGFGNGGIGVGVGVENCYGPTVGLAKRNSGQTPVISINGVELVDGAVGSLASLNGNSSSASGMVPTRIPEPSSQLQTFLSSNVTPHSSLSSSSPSSHPSTSTSPALKAAGVASVGINTWPRRHRPDRLKNACAIDDDIDLQCSVQSAAACLPSSSSRGADYSGEGPGNSENGPVVREQGGSGGREAAVDGYAYGDTHADVNGTVTGMHERGGKFQCAEPGDRIIDDNVGVGVGDAAVDDGDIDTVIPCDPYPLFDLTHNHHLRFLQQDEDSEDTPVARSPPLPLTHSFSTTPPQSPPPDSPLRSAPSSRPLSPDFSRQALPPSNSSVQSLLSFSSSIHTDFPHPDQDSNMGLLNLMTRTPLVPSPDAHTHAAQTRVAHVGGGRSAATISRVSTPPPISVDSLPPAVPVLHQAAVSAISVASQTSSKSSKLSKAAKKSRMSKSSGSLDVSSSASASSSDIATDSQLLPSTMLLPPKLATPYAVSPLAFDPATYFDSFSSVSIAAGLSANSTAGVLTRPSSSSSLSTGVLTKPRALVQKAGPAWFLRETVVEDDEDDEDSDSEDEAETKQAIDMEPPIVPSISPPVLAGTTLEVPEVTTQLSKPPSPPPPLIRPSILSPAPPSPRPDLSMPTRTPPSFVPVAPLSISKKNPQSSPSEQKQKPGPAPAPASGVASLLARRFSFRSKSGGNLRGSYTSSSSPGPGASRPSSPSPLRNESFERRVAEVVSMLENVSVSGAVSGIASSAPVGGKEGPEAPSALLPSSSSATPLGSNSTPALNPSNPTSTIVRPTPALSSSSSSSTAPSAWTTQKLDLSQSPSSSVDTDTFFEFGTGTGSSSGSGSASLGSISTTPGTSPGPQLAAMAGPLSGSLAKRWRRWSNNLGVWEREGQKDKQQDIGSSASANAQPGAGTGPSASTSTSQGQVQQELPGRSTIGEGGVVLGPGGATSGSAESQTWDAIQERLGEASSLTGKGTGNIVDDEVSPTASASTSLGASSTATAMPFTAPVSLPTASVPTPTTRKLVKQRPNLRSASVDDQHHHDLQRIFSADDASTAASASTSSRLRTKKPKFTLGGHSYGSSDTPDSPKTASFSTHGSAAGSSTAGSSTTTANGLARRDTFRPPLIRRDAVVTPEQATRRWTLASAITDEAISDEGLLKELERIRMVGEWDRRRARAVEREKGQGKNVDRRTRALSLDAQEDEQEDEAEQTEEEDEVQLWEIDVGFEIWEGREGMLAREMERVRAAERQRLDREKENADGDAASVSTGSSGHGSSSESAENSTNTTPETTPSLSPLVMSPGFAAATSTSPEPASATKAVLTNATANKTTSLVKQPAPTWLAAQRALLICRELILTERRYLGLMCLLLDTHTPPPSYAHQYQANPHASMRTSASTSDIPSLQQHYRGIQQRLQYHSSAATATYASLPPAQSSSGSQQTHVLVGPAPPARMLAATMPLAETTARFLRALEGAPSVGGVAKAFVDHEMEMEEVYIAWCREVGAWFADGSTAGSDATGSANRGYSAMSKVPSPPGSMDGHTSHGHEDGSGDGGSSTIRLVPIPPPTPPLPGIPPFGGVASGNALGSSSSPTSPLKRVAGSWRRSMNSIPSLVGGGSSSGGLYAANVDAHVSERKQEREREHEKEKEPLAAMPMPTAAGGEMLPSSPTTALAAGFVFISGDRVLSSGGSAYANGGLGGLASRSGGNSNAGTSAGVEAPPAKPLRKLGVRDLAILPTQRVMRYVLLYRDLLAHTPAAASSRVLVERALAVATRIAENCDRAQGHNAFIAPNAASSPPSASSTNPNNATSPKNATPLSSVGSALDSGTSSGANASRSGSGTSGSGNSSGSGWRRKAQTRSRTASLSAGPVPVLVPMTPVVRTSVAQKT